MKKVLIVVAMIALAASASAKVQFFITKNTDGYGLTNPALAFDPTMDLQNDSYHYAVGTFPPTTDPPPIPSINPNAGEFGYLWIRFYDDVAGAKVQGIHIGYQRGGAWITPGGGNEFAYYVCNDIAVQGGTKKRWDGPATPPDDPEFKTNPQVLAAVTAEGIINAKTASEWNLFSGNQGTPPPAIRTALLGAVKFEPGNYDVTLALGSLGFKYAGTSEPLPPGIQFFGATIVPEPAGLLLLGLASLAIRRR